MKGTLRKAEQGWVVEYNYSWIKKDWETLPLYPQSLYPQDVNPMLFRGQLPQHIMEGRVVEFEIVHFWENGEVGANGLAYAKLIKEEKPSIDNRKDKLETLAKLLAKTWFYCDWKWESPNERVMQMLMQDLGLYPFKDEDEMIQQTKIDDGLDDELYKEANRRVPVYGKPSADLVKSKISETYTGEYPFVDDIHFGDLRNVDVDSFHKGYDKAKETLFTEEQVKYIVERSRETGLTAEYIMQTLKQPKK